MGPQHYLKSKMEEELQVQKEELKSNMKDLEHRLDANIAELEANG